jgi:surface protein
MSTTTTNREEQFSLTPSVIEKRKLELKKLSMEDLQKALRVQDGRDPQDVSSEVIEVDKENLIDNIINRMLKNHHPVTEERYQFVESLYLIRKQHGNHYGFLQPDFICIIFGKMMPSKKLQRSDDDIYEAVNAWCEDPVAATAKYGHISKWNTTLVTSMKRLFQDKIDFNDDISKWDVSNVTEMSYMFDCHDEDRPFLADGWVYSEDVQQKVSAFNGDISGWNVSKVNNMVEMFRGATSFNGNISSWNVSKVIDMNSMFSGASSFNCDISGWNVSNATRMYFLFFHATSFNRDIRAWDVSKVDDMDGIFEGASSFKFRRRTYSAWRVMLSKKICQYMFISQETQEMNDHMDEYMEKKAWQESMC